MGLLSRRRGGRKRNDEEGGNNISLLAPALTFKDGEIEGMLDKDTKNPSGDHNSSQADSIGWKKAQEHFKILDDGVVKDYSEEVDAVLVFAGLFSAILTAFIVEVQKNLQEDMASTSVQILRRISMQLHAAADNPVALPTKFKPSRTIVAVNGLWFSSLIISLFTALLGILVKQWLHVYSKWHEREQPRDTLILRDFYQEGLIRWRVPDIIGMLPVLLQIALLLFAVGLVTHMWTLNLAIAGVLSVLVTAMVFLAALSIALPIFYEDCPYKSPLGFIMIALQARYSNSPYVRRFSSWQRRDLRRAKHDLDQNSTEGITAQSALVLDIYPRIDLDSALKKPIPNDSLIGSRIRRLPEETLRLLLDPITPLTDAPNLAASGYALHSIHLLDYIARTSKGTMRRNAAGAIVNILIAPSDPLESIWLNIVQRLLRYDIKAKKRVMIPSVPSHLAVSLHRWGTRAVTESKRAAEICLYSMNLAVEVLRDDNIIQSKLENRSLYDVLLNLLQFWIRSAKQLQHLEGMVGSSEENFRNMFDRHRARLTKLTSLGGHNALVSSVAFSPDGLLVASGSEDKTIRVWNVQSHVPVAVLKGHEDRVTSVTFSPDGARIASGSLDKTIRIWDAAKLTTIMHLTGHESSVESVAFSFNGLRIASGSRDETVRVWNARTGDLLAVLTGHKSRVTSIAFSPNGLYIASGSDDKTIHVWDVHAGVAPIVLKGHTDWVTSIAFSSNGRHIVSGSDDMSVRVWDAQTSSAVTVLKGHTSRVTSVAFSPDGSRIAYGSEDKAVRMCHITNIRVNIAKFQGHSSSITSVAFSPDGLRIASGSDDTSIRLWNTQAGAAVSTAFKAHTKRVTSVAFSAISSLIASAADDGTVRLWDSRIGDIIGVLEGHTDHVTSIAFSPDGLRIASGSEDETVCVWDVQARLALMTLEGHTDWITSVAFAPNGSRIASGSGDMSVRLWDAETGMAISVFTIPKSWATSVTFSHDGRYLASGIDDSTVCIWDTQTSSDIVVAIPDSNSILDSASISEESSVVFGSEDENALIRDEQTGMVGIILRGHTSVVNSVIFSPDGLYIASGSNDRTIRLWDTPQGNRAKASAILGDHTDWVTSVAFSFDGSRIASGSEDRTVRVWDPQTRAAITILRGHTSGVNSVVFLSDASQIASGSSDKTVRVWNTEIGGVATATLAGHTAKVTFVVFSPDGSLLASSSDDKTVRIWSVETGAAITVYSDHTSQITAIAFSPDGSRVASSSFDKTVHVWDAYTGAPIRILTEAYRRDVQAYLLPSASPTTDVSLSKPSPVFIFESGWILCQRAQDEFPCRLCRLSNKQIEPTSQIVSFNEWIAYGTEPGDIVFINYSDYLRT